MLVFKEAATQITRALMRDEHSTRLFSFYPPSLRRYRVRIQISRPSLGSKTRSVQLKEDRCEAYPLAISFPFPREGFSSNNAGASLPDRDRIA